MTIPKAFRFSIHTRFSGELALDRRVISFSSLDTQGFFNRPNENLSVVTIAGAG
jgi:hypothetical protein